MEITSIENPRVKFWEKLKQKKYRDHEKLFLIEDDHLVNEALKNNAIKEIITTNKDINYDIPTYYVTEKIMRLLSNQKTGSNLIAVCHTFKEREVKGNILLLDNLQDPGNLGTIIRSAVAFNFDSIILSDDSVDMYNPKVIRSSEGMIFHINIIRTNLINFLNNLDSNYVKIATNVNEGKDIKNINYKNCALIIGNEGNGIRKEIYDLCDEIVFIKMNKKCESLNAGVSAGILMYEVFNG